MKLAVLLLVARFSVSSPSRGTWIEIGVPACEIQDGKVVPLTGDVD